MSENDPIPYERFQKVNEARRAAEEQIKALEARITEVEALATRAKDLEVALAKAERVASNLTATVDHGITSKDGRELAEYCYSKTPEDGRPAFNEWLTGQREAPTGLMKHAWPSPTPSPSPSPTPPPPAQEAPVSELESSEAAPKADTAIETPTAPQPNVNGQAVPDPRAHPTFSADVIRGLTPEQYRAQRDAIVGSLTNS